MKRRSRVWIACGLLLVSVTVFVSSKVSHQSRSNNQPAPAAAKALPAQPAPGTSAQVTAMPAAVAHAQASAATQSAAARNSAGLARFPNSQRLALREVTDPNGDVRRIELLKTPMKYPFVRVESTVRSDPATQQESSTITGEAVADHLLVELQPGKTEKDLADAVSSVHGTIARKLKLEYCSTYIIQLPEPTLDAVPDAVKQLSALSDIFRIAEPDGIQHEQAMPNDPRFSQQWGLHNYGQTGGAADADIDAPEAWNVTIGSDSVIVAVSDSGIDYTHVDLSDNMWTNPREVWGNFRDDDANGYMDDIRGWDFYDVDTDPMDETGHGTFVAGIIAARGNNSIGVAGVSWHCKLMPLRVLGPYGGYNSDIAEAFDYARVQGASIINASHAGETGTGVLQTAVNSLNAAGVLLVAAAGNGGSSGGMNIDSSPLYPAAYPNANVISVGYSDANDNPTEYSNYGIRNVDLFAPGDNIYSTFPNQSYMAKSGSSFSTPMVSGVAALLKAKYPTWNYRQIRTAILNNVDGKAAMAPFCYSGGRLNAYKALAYSVVPLAQALDTGSMLTWRSGGALPWATETRTTHDGVDAAESGEIPGNTNSWIETTVYGPGTINFWWRVSSESDPYGIYFYDYAAFLIDGKAMAAMDGETGWQPQSFAVPEGIHVLRWSYEKDATYSLGQDRVSLDQVRYDGLPPTITSQPQTQALLAGGSTVLSASASGTPVFHFQWKKNGVNIAGATSSSLALANVKAASAGTYTLLVTNYWGARISDPAVLTVCDYVPTPASAVMPSEGGAGSFDVAAGGPCDWTASTTNSWITVLTTTGSGPGTVSYSVTPNDSEVARAGYIKVENHCFVVKQLGRFTTSMVAGMSFTMAITNGTGDFPTNGSFVLALSGISNTFQVASYSAAVPTNSGVYVYTQQDSSNALLELTDSNGTIGTELSFVSPVAGNYLSTNQAGATQSGTFTMTPKRLDLNSDGLGDLLLQHTSRVLATWFMNGTNFVKSAYVCNGTPLPAGWRIAACADFNADGQSDLLLQDTTGRLALRLMNGANLSASVLINTNPGVAWRAVGAADFNNDGKTDVLLQHTSGVAMLLLMDGTNCMGSARVNTSAVAPAAWRIAAVADFNDDRQNDLLVQNTNGVAGVWFVVGTEVVGSTLLNGGKPVVGWTLVTLNDFDGDGRNDILWEGNSGALAVWLMNGTTLKGGVRIRYAPPGWWVIGPK